MGAGLQGTHFVVSPLRDNVMCAAKHMHDAVKTCLGGLPLWGSVTRDAAQS
jgi:hypothetical protein